MQRRAKARRFLFPGSKARRPAFVVFSSQSSAHTDPLRPMHANRVSRASSQIKCNPARKRTAVVDHDGYRSSVTGIGDRHL